MALGSPLVIIIWLAYVGFWIFSPGILADIMQWVQGLPLVWEIIVWIVFLPWVVSLWIWHGTWPLWLRIILIIGIALATMGGSASGAAKRKSRRRVKATPDHEEREPAPPAE